MFSGVSRGDLDAWDHRLKFLISTQHPRGRRSFENGVLFVCLIL